MSSIGYHIVTDKIKRWKIRKVLYTPLKQRIKKTSSESPIRSDIFTQPNAGAMVIPRLMLW